MEVITLRAAAPQLDLVVTLRNFRKVRETPRWPRSWADFSPLWLSSHINAWANLRLLDQPNTFLAAVMSVR